MRRNLRWGIMGTANIAKKIWRALAITGNSVLAGVASRDAARCQRFISECQREVPMPLRPAAYGSYEEMLQSGDIDAVYIPLPTGIRADWVNRAAEAGKHVLCEKPCANSVAELERMLSICRRRKVQFMDGVMFMHGSRLAQLRKVLHDKKSIGSLKRITSAFSYRASPDFFRANIRSDARLEPHGCVGDLGWYCIRLALWAVDWKMPVQTSGRILGWARASAKSKGVISEFSAELLFPRGVSSAFYCAFVAENQEWAILSGSRGYIHMNDFVLPIAGRETSFEVRKLDFDIKGTDFTMRSNVNRKTVREHGHGEKDAQETNMLRNFATQVLSGKLNQEWPEQALMTQTVMEQCIDRAVANDRPAILSPHSACLPLKNCPSPCRAPSMP